MVGFLEFDFPTLERNSTQLRTRRAHNPSDLKDILQMYDAHFVTVANALSLVCYLDQKPGDP